MIQRLLRIPFIASRMESHGESGEIQITEAAYDLIKDEFECQSRGAIEVKGKGVMNTWFVTGNRSHPS
jgi:guanylate cyclase